MLPPGQRHPSAGPAVAKVRGLSAPARTGRHPPRNPTGRTNALHRRLAARRRYTAPGQHRPEQGLGSSRAQERATDRVPRRNPRPLERRPALAHGWAQPARRHRHLREYCPSRRSGQTAKTRRADDGRARAPGPHLTPWVGPHPVHRRIPVAKAPIADLAYDSAPYRSRPVSVQISRPERGGHDCEAGNAVDSIGTNFTVSHTRPIEEQGSITGPTQTVWLDLPNVGAVAQVHAQMVGGREPEGLERHPSDLKSTTRRADSNFVFSGKRLVAIPHCCRQPPFRHSACASSQAIGAHFSESSY